MANKFAYLLWVEGNDNTNHNKYYQMTENPDGNTFTAEWGRVDVTSSTKVYSIYEWGKTYRSKIKKGYKDVTEMREVPIVETKNSKSIFDGIKNDSVINLIKFLMDSAQNAIKDNYTISTKKVTKKMICEAQIILNKISVLQKEHLYNGQLSENTIKEINNLFIELFTILPRKMKKVSDYLISLNIKSLKDSNIEERLSEEQSLLDTMEGQVGIIQTNNEDNTENNENILEQMGILIELVESKKEKDKVFSLFEENSGNKRKVKNIYKVINSKTDKAMSDVQNTETSLKKTMLLFHGSRNQNWFNILRSGLLIRPTGVITTGSMFGNGIYLANKSQKSLGYSSLSGSYWTGGNSNKGFLAIYEAAVGNQKHIYTHNSSCYNLNYNTISKEGYDSVYAHAGQSLRNDEFMVYRPEQCSIRYLIEMEN